MAGLFFCLASAEGAGLLFCLAAIQSHTSIYSVFCVVNAVIPPTPQNSTQSFAAAFPAIMPAQQPAIPDQHNKLLHHLCHAGGHTRARTRSTDTRYHRHAGTLYRSAQAAYYNKVYKRAQGCALSRIHVRRCSISQTIPAAAHLLRGQPGGVSMLPTPGGLQSGTGSTVNQGGAASWHPPPGGAVQRQGRGGRRGTTGGYRRISFRAFAR